MKKSLVLLLFLVHSATVYVQEIEQFVFADEGPHFSFKLGEQLIRSADFDDVTGVAKKTCTYQDKLVCSVEINEDFELGLSLLLRLSNRSQDTLEIHNFLPFGEDPDRVYITGKGRHGLSRTHLFRPDLKPVNVIVPDNAWELGFCEVKSGDLQVYGLSRRTASEKTSVRRFENYLYPGGWVEFTLYYESYSGNWQSGLRKAFQKRLLYDLEHFDNQLYQREDLQWVRHTYVSHLIYGWDHAFYESETGEFMLNEFIQRGQKLYGGDDFIGIWPTWPSLGLDQRNQWDLFRDLPGGLKQLSKLAQECRALGTRFFICYNPWDEDTRAESHTTGMADLIEQIGADGVVLDTRGSSSHELQQAADSVRSGVVMYSEGMAVPRDMPGIVSGRVHNALYYPPMLNLNKLIKPDFAIFRVAELAYEPIRREYATSFFNGYGTELNIFRPGRPDWAEQNYHFFGRTVRILREHSDCFVNYGYEPLIPTLHDDIWVNQWSNKEKVIYTIYSLRPDGFKGALFKAPERENYHWVDLWNHHEIVPDTIHEEAYIPVRTDAFHQEYLGTNNEGAVTAIGHFPALLRVNGHADRLTISAEVGDEIWVWAGLPDYEKKARVFRVGHHELNLTAEFGRFEGDIIIQLLRDDQVIDERIYELKPSTCRLISTKETTKPVKRAPKNMVAVTGGEFMWKTTNGDEFIPYPPVHQPDTILRDFFIDVHPVTNRAYLTFVEETAYSPVDRTNYLKHWANGKPVKADEEKPVVYVAYEDAQAYAKWAGKRLPTELEWQYAAQTSDCRPWPWTTKDTIQRETQYVTNTLTVSRLKGVGERFCNPGNGNLDRIGQYPAGANPLGIHDLVGSVWQLTHDLYDNGSNHFVIMKGGSYFNPGSSWWYVQGGPRPLHYRQMLLRVSRGFERNATVGFRCVKDRLPNY